MPTIHKLTGTITAHAWNAARSSEWLQPAPKALVRDAVLRPDRIEFVWGCALSSRCRLAEVAICPNNNEIWIFGNAAESDTSKWTKEAVLAAVSKHASCLCLV